jgi:hypothetical protein
MEKGDSFRQQNQWEFWDQTPCTAALYINRGSAMTTAKAL